MYWGSVFQKSTPRTNFPLGSVYRLKRPPPQPLCVSPPPTSFPHPLLRDIACMLYARCLRCGDPWQMDPLGHYEIVKRSAAANLPDSSGTHTHTHAHTHTHTHTHRPAHTHTNTHTEINGSGIAAQRLRRGRSGGIGPYIVSPATFRHLFFLLSLSLFSPPSSLWCCLRENGSEACDEATKGKRGKKCLILLSPSPSLFILFRVILGCVHTFKRNCSQIAAERNDSPTGMCACMQVSASSCV